MATKKKQLLSLIEYILMRICISILQVFPYSISQKIVVFLFISIGYGIGIRKKIAFQQLMKVYPKKSKCEIRTIVKKMYRNMALSICEIYLLSDDKLLTKSYLEGLEHYEKAISKGKGAILFTGHFGNWEAAGRFYPMVGINISVIVKRQRNHLFDNYTNKIRTRQGAELIPMKNALRGVLAHLKQNELVAILIDQNAGSRGLLSIFLGYPATNWIGAAKIAIKYQVPILPAFVIRNSDDSLTFKFDEPIFVEEMDDNEQSYLFLIKKMNGILENYIHKYPHLWFWVHKRWKHGYNMFS